MSNCEIKSIDVGHLRCVKCGKVNEINQTLHEGQTGFWVCVECATKIKTFRVEGVVRSEIVKRSKEVKSHTITEEDLEDAGMEEVIAMLKNKKEYVSVLECPNCKVKAEINHKLSVGQQGYCVDCRKAFQVTDIKNGKVVLEKIKNNKVTVMTGNETREVDLSVIQEVMCDVREIEGANIFPGQGNYSNN